MGMLFKKADYREQYFNEMIPKMYDSGLIDHTINKWKSPKGMNEKIILREEALVLEHLILPLIFLCGGICFSVVMFVAELGEKWCSKGSTILQQ